MTATFRINQNGVNGTWGLARTNLELFSVAGSVTLEAQDAHSTYLWEIIADMEGSTGVLSAPTAQVTTIDLNVTGSWIIRLTVDAAIPATKDILELKMAIPLPNSGAVMPAARETIQDNQYTGADAGYQIEMHRLIKWLDANSGGTLSGVPTVVVDTIATWDDTNATLIGGSPLKSRTVLETIEATPDHPTRRLEAQTSEGSDYATLLRHYGDEVGGNMTQLGDETSYGGKINRLKLTAEEDPFVQIIGTGIGRLIHEYINTIWHIRQRGRISHDDGDAAPVLELQNTGTNPDLIGITVGSGGGTPEGRISALPGSLHIDGNGTSATLYQHRGASSGTTGWVEIGPVDLSGYFQLAGRAGGQTAIGGTGTTDSLVLQATAGVGAAGSNIDFKVGNAGATLAMQIQNSGIIFIPNGLKFFNAGDFNAIFFNDGSSDNFFIKSNLAGAGDGNALVFASDAVAEIIRLTRSTGTIYLGSQTSSHTLTGQGTIVGRGAEFNEEVYLDGGLTISSDSPALGKVWTSDDSNGAGSWKAGVEVLESRTSVVTLDENDKTMIIKDGPITVTIPASATHGKVYWIMNANGVTNGAGTASNVTLDIFGSTVEFNGGNSVGNTLVLANDGDWARIEWDNNEGTWWVQSNISLDTGDTA